MFGNSNSVLTSKDQYAKYQYHLLSKDHEVIYDINQIEIRLSGVNV